MTRPPAQGSTPLQLETPFHSILLANDTSSETSAESVIRITTFIMSLSSEPFHRQASSISSDIVDVEGNESVDIHTDSEPEDSLAVDPSTSHIHEEDSSFDIESDSDADSDTGDYNNPQHQGRSGVLVESSANTPALIFNNTKHTEMERSETIDAQGYGQNNLQVLGRLRGRSLEDDEEDEDEDDFFSLTNGSNHSILPQTPLAASSPTMRSQSPLALGSSVSLPEDPFQRNGSPTPGMCSDARDSFMT